MQFLLPSGQEPVTWWRDKPIYLTIVLIIIHVVALLVTSLLMAFHSELVGRMLISGPALWSGEIWRVLTFPLVQVPSFWVLIELFMLWMFGMQVEQALGWRRFLLFYLVLCVAPVVPVLALSPWMNLQLGGTDAANLAVFIGFATLHPDAPMLFNTKAKWWAWGLLALIGLQTLAFPAMKVVGLATLFTAGVAYFYLKAQGVRGGFGWLNHWQQKREEDRYQREQRRRRLESSEHFISEKVDPILDKISREGVQSLTDEERRILERAKDKLR